MLSNKASTKALLLKEVYGDTGSRQRKKLPLKKKEPGEPVDAADGEHVVFDEEKGDFVFP